MEKNITKMLFEHLLQILLNFSRPIFIIPILITGCYFRKKLFSNAASLLLLSIILNIALKLTFKVPLPQHLASSGFAFPSGHMQSSMVLYGWLALKTNKTWFKLSTALLLGIIAFGLEYFRYHSYFDIVGAVFFGATLLYFYNLLTIKYNQFHTVLVSLGLANFLMIYIASRGALSPNLLMPYFALIGFAGVELLTKKVHL